WFTVNGARIQGRDNVRIYLEDHPEVAADIEQKIRENYVKLMTPQAKKAAKAAGRAVDISADDFEG
ncbi:MAG: DNA recombination/repair protein RecA, partial [Oscillospiraceae bacterium]|nr:DNA recombination/repair protein RecA [Oscillospiraceae bacterium]